MGRVNKLILLMFFPFVAFVFALSFMAAGEIYRYSDTVGLERLPEVDAIVCLAGGRGRIGAAGDLWYRYWKLSQQPTDSKGVQKVPVLYLSGMGSKATWNALSKQIHHSVISAIRPDDLIIERESSNTDENARWLARYAKERHWRRVLLLTSTYHMKRAKFIFDRVFRFLDTPMVLETLSVHQEPFALENWRHDPVGVRVTLLEYVKWLYYRSLWQVL